MHNTPGPERPFDHVVANLPGGRFIAGHWRDEPRALLHLVDVEHHYALTAAIEEFPHRAWETTSGYGTHNVLLVPRLVAETLPFLDNDGTSFYGCESYMIDELSGDAQRPEVFVPSLRQLDDDELIDLVAWSARSDMHSDFADAINYADDVAEVVNAHQLRWPVVRELVGNVDDTSLDDLDALLAAAYRRDTVTT